MQKHNFFVKQIFFQDEVEILTFFDGDDDFGDDDEDEYIYISDFLSLTKYHLVRDSKQQVYVAREIATKPPVDY